MLAFSVYTCFFTHCVVGILPLLSELTCPFKSFCICWFCFSLQEFLRTNDKKQHQAHGTFQLWVDLNEDRWKNRKRQEKKAESFTTRPHSFSLCVLSWHALPKSAELCSRKSRITKCWWIRGFPLTHDIFPLCKSTHVFFSEILSLCQLQSQSHTTQLCSTYNKTQRKWTCSAVLMPHKEKGKQNDMLSKEKEGKDTRWDRG